MSETPKTQNKTLKFILIGGALIASICACLIVVSSLSPTERTPDPQLVAEIIADTDQPIDQDDSEDIPEEPTNTSPPANTPIPRDTATPRPTATPTATPDPNLVRAGTYLVGVDIQPGLYRGYAGTRSCYWERLSDLSGQFSAIIANNNSLGQFYILVDEEDHAFHVSCEVVLLDPIPEPVDEFPEVIDTGTYLVGLDIQPGLYKGDAGTRSCYWERLSDLLGGFGGLIANDNAVGQFYVSVAENDEAFHVSCQVMLLDPMPEPVTEFPEEIDPGTYLVGIDILPGLYQGHSETGSCYWERLRGTSGGFADIIANDNSTGQYYIQVASSDYALKTACSLVRAGD